MDPRILTIDMSKKSAEWSASPERFALKGGRALTSTIIAEDVDPKAHPLSKNNVLAFAPGLISGTFLSSSNRLSAGTKSPLTGGIKESNSGGLVGIKLAKLGIKALKVTGSARDQTFPSLGIVINAEGITFEDFSFLKGLGTYESAEKLIEKYGKKCGYLLIGQAGESMLNAACISINDAEGEPCRNLGRGGLGAVMGSKGIKAIVIDDAGTPVLHQDNPAVKNRIKTFANQLREHPVTGEKFPMYGTVMTLMGLNALGGLATRNFSQGEYEHADKISADTIRQNMLDRGGQPTHACMPGCVIRCSNKYVDKAGKPIVGSMEFETVGLFGSNLDNPDPDEIAEMNLICNDLGLDTIEVGCALGVLCEAGIVAYGDSTKFKELLKEIGEDTPLGRILGSGAETCGKVFSVTNVPSVKGQGMAAYDPRAIKGMGVTYATSAMGADHTAANAITLAVDHLDPKAQLAPIKELMTQYMILDSLGLCIFTGRVSLSSPEVLEQLVNDYTGRGCTHDDLMREAWDALKMEKQFNEQAGLGSSTDDVPAYMREEKLAPNNSTFDIPKEDLNKFL